MFKFSIKTPILTADQFAAIVAIQPNLAGSADKFAFTAVQAEAAVIPDARAKLVRYEYFKRITTVADEANEFWVTEFVCMGD